MQVLLEFSFKLREIALFLFQFVPESKRPGCSPLEVFLKSERPLGPLFEIFLESERPLGPVLEFFLDAASPRGSFLNLRFQFRDLGCAHLELTCGLRQPLACDLQFPLG